MSKTNTELELDICFTCIEKLKEEINFLNKRIEDLENRLNNHIHSSSNENN